MCSGTEVLSGVLHSPGQPSEAGGGVSEDSREMAVILLIVYLGTWDKLTFSLGL